ncbi:MAG: nucleoside deaminase [Proteobacteria bacterium]|nr:nucleoside deaminase [Pseudomonadota bacterium]MBU4011280.1 nucleoside deaminase [Pseudomonadota bacterium]MBU4037229.1 nucleoside deaminase [Pseudomonadota bacterium]
MDHEYFMETALNLAQEALEQGEFPVGCVLVHKDKIIATGKREGTVKSVSNEVDHAEMMALRNLAGIENHNEISRQEITIYCTMEPCLMCFAAILLSGIGKIVFAYEDVMGGGTNCNTQNLSPLYKDNKISVVSGILRKESLNIFKMYFYNPSNTYWKGSLLAHYTLSQK